MTGLEITHSVRELRELEGVFVKKIYDMGEGAFSILFYPERGGSRELIIDIRGFIFLTKMKWNKPKYPSPFTMGLRKRLEDARIESIYQMGLERIISLEFSRNDLKMVIELFGGGNIILLSGNEIIAAYRKAKYRDREIRVGVAYNPPPTKTPHLRDFSEEEINEAVLKTFPMEERISRVLISLGLGPPYLNEVLMEIEAGAESKLSDIDPSKLVRVIKGFFARESEPTVYLDDSEVVEYSAFPLSHLSYRRERFGTLSEALERYYAAKRTKIEDERIPSLQKEIERQLSLKEEYESSYEKFRRIGDLIMSNLHVLDEAIRVAKSGGSSDLIISLDKSSARLIVSIDGEEIPLDLRKSASENAADYYVKAKRMKEKALKIDQAISQLEDKLRGLKESLLREISAETPKPRRKIRWYERYRWFYTSSGLLVICGRDSQTNSEIVSKFMEDDDLFFHVDMPGGAAVVLKTSGSDPDPRSIEQAAVAAACFSKAWREGLSYAEVYYVKGSQVRRHAPAGMYLPKGSFYIEGKRNYVRAKLELALGFQNTPDGLKLTAAPLDAPLICPIRIRPGSMGKEEAAIRIKNKLKECVAKSKLKISEGVELPVEEISLDELMRAMPPGRVEVEE